MSFGVRSRAAGFSLIEVLLATALLATGLAIAFSVLTASVKAVQRGDAIARKSEHVGAVENFLRTQVSGARPLAFGNDPATGLPQRFLGEATRMRFVADLPGYLGRGGPTLHDLQVVGTKTGAELRVSFATVMGGRVFAEEPERRPEILATGLKQARFRYRTLDTDGQPGEWRDRWDEADRLPLQVEIVLSEQGGSTWPPMLVSLPLAERRR